MTLVKLKTKLGPIVMIRISSIDAIYQQQVNKKDWGVLLHSGVTYMIEEDMCDLLLKAIDEAEVRTNTSS